MLQSAGGGYIYIYIYIYLQKKQIPAFGPNKMYFYNLTAIAIDYMEYFKENAIGWNWLPKNATDLKTKILELLQIFRKRTDGGSYELDQDMFLNLLFENWGGRQALAQIVDNDKLRVFGLLLTIDKNNISWKDFWRKSKINSN